MQDSTGPRSTALCVPDRTLASTLVARGCSGPEQRLTRIRRLSRGRNNSPRTLQGVVPVQDKCRQGGQRRGLFRFRTTGNNGRRGLFRFRTTGNNGRRGLFRRNSSPQKPTGVVL